MKTVRILGNAPNLAEMPPTPPEWEVFACNQKRGYAKWLPRIYDACYGGPEWTRWINLHSREHMVKTYPKDFEFFKTQTKPIYFQQPQPDVPSSRAFPYKDILQFFGHRYFTCSAAWLIAFAIFEGFERIELWGFQVSKRKWSFAWERPCIFYWIQEAQRRGIEVWWPKIGTEDWDFSEAGNPYTYTGDLYGYSTKPEPGWNPHTDDWD